MRFALVDSKHFATIGKSIADKLAFRCADQVQAGENRQAGLVLVFKIGRLADLAHTTKIGQRQRTERGAAKLVQVSVGATDRIEQRLYSLVGCFERAKRLSDLSTRIARRDFSQVGIPQPAFRRLAGGSFGLGRKFRFVELTA